MAQLNIDTKFTVFNLVHDEHKFYVMSPTDLWEKRTDHEVEAELLGKTSQEYFDYLAAMNADIEYRKNYAIVSFKEKKFANKYCKVLNDAYTKVKVAKWRLTH
jgi:hypothetical protein